MLDELGVKDTDGDGLRELPNGKKLALRIDADYAGKDLPLVGVLKGAVMVMADLSRRIEHQGVEMDWMAVSSYGSGTKSSAVVRILKDLDADLSGRHVLIVEDIIDSGLTLSWLISNLRSRGPASVEVAAMLRKPDAVRVDHQRGHPVDELAQRVVELLDLGPQVEFPGVFDREFVQAEDVPDLDQLVRAGIDSSEPDEGLRAALRCRLRQ